MDQSYHDLSQELGDVPAMVCLDHGRFIPCRSPEPHRVSSDPADIEKVRYHQEVCVRLQPKPPPPPEYQEVSTPAEKWPFTLDQEYGSSVIRCGGWVLSRPRRGVNDTRHIAPCRDTFSASTPGELLTEVRRHILATPHHEAVRGD